jgi:hypothetical protein
MRTLMLLALVVSLLPAGPALAQPACAFQLGFKAIADQIPDRVGGCLEDEHFNLANGNAEQRTSAHHGQGGLLVWRKADNWTAFTDGHWTWVNGPSGLQRRLNAERFAWERDTPAASGRLKVGIYGWDPAAAADRAAARELGMTTAQIAVDWNALEFDEVYHDQHAGLPGSFEERFVGALDARVRATADAGLEPILLVTNPPGWALQTPQTQGPLKPEKSAKYANFVARLLQRYRPATHVVLWPEPDHKGALPEGCPVAAYHRAWGDVPEQFAAMLKTTYPVVKAARPDVQIVMGALAYDNTAGRCAAFAERFLDGVLAAGGGDGFDVFAFNSYAVFAAVWEERVPGRYDVAAKASYLRSRYPSIAGKPTMVLEAGVWSDASVPLPLRLPDGTIGTVVPDAAWQAAYPAKLLARAHAAGLTTVLWYGLRDEAHDVKRGLFDQAGGAKPSLATFRHAAARLADATYVGPAQPAAVHSGAVEGYAFARPDGSRLTVLWAAGDQSARARVTLGPADRVEDAAGSALSAAAALDLGPSPVFVVGAR